MLHTMIHHLPPVDHASVNGNQKEILDVALMQVGLISNIYANMANAPGVLSTHLHGYAFSQ